jgi:sporulation related protein
MWWGDDGAYFVCSFARLTDGSAAQHDGQIWFLDPLSGTIELKLHFAYTPSARDGWTVDVAVVADRTSAVELVRRLRSAGFAAEVLTLQRPPDDRRPGPLGYRVRSGLLATRAESDARVADWPA